MNSCTSSFDEEARARRAFRRRLIWSIAGIVIAAFSSFAAKQTGGGIFACTGAGYSSDTYISECLPWYGNYEVALHQFGSDPVIAQAITAADVLFLGNSHVGYAFANEAIGQWFGQRRERYYLMHFPAQGDGGARVILDRFRPKPRVVVINADPFFGIPAEPRLFSDTLRERFHFRAKQWWQRVHRGLCGRWPGLCRGKGAVVFRERSTGRWLLQWSTRGENIPVREARDRLLDTLPKLLEDASAFIATLPVPRQCIVLTSIPGNFSTPEVSRRLAADLGLVYLRPELDGLTTLDGGHLTPESGERWTRAFLNALGPMVDRCTSGKPQS